MAEWQNQYNTALFKGTNEITDDLVAIRPVPNFDSGNQALKDQIINN